MNQWHVAIAAEAVAAAQFARCGYDVSVQYGANQPEYDLMVARKENILKVSVKGSQDGCWGLAQNFIKGHSYHEAATLWEARHSPRTVLCFVQFKEVAFDELPRLYLAWPCEVAKRLRETANGRGDTILHERHQWSPRAFGAGSTEVIPCEWQFTQARLDQLFQQAETETHGNESQA
jgi:hypothetical protein